MQTTRRSPGTQRSLRAFGHPRSPLTSDHPPFTLERCRNRSVNIRSRTLATDFRAPSGIGLLFFGLAETARAYGLANATGGLEPINRVGAPCTTPIPNPWNPPEGTGSSAYDILAAWSAALKCLPSEVLSGGTWIPNHSDPVRFTGPEAILQFAFSSALANWYARKYASGSPSVHCRLTVPGCLERASANASA